jgi:hypothetical protein
MVAVADLTTFANPSQLAVASAPVRDHCRDPGGPAAPTRHTSSSQTWPSAQPVTVGSVGVIECGRGRRRRAVVPTWDLLNYSYLVICKWRSRV